MNPPVEVPGARKILCLGIGLQVIPIACTALSFGMAIGLMRHIETTGEAMQSGEFSTALTRVIAPMMFGSLFALVGLVLISLAVVKWGVRARWVFWFLIVYGPAASLTSPFGWLFGVFFLVFALTKRNEFFVSEQ